MVAGEVPAVAVAAGAPGIRAILVRTLRCATIGAFTNSGIPLQTALLPEECTVLAPDGSEIRELVQSSRGSLVHCTLPPGAVSGPVSHRTVEEVWYFLSGRGQVWRKSEDHESVENVERGVSLTIETGTHFQFRNDSSIEPLEFIITTMPPWPGPDEAYPVPGLWTADKT